MRSLADDFMAESEALHALVVDLDPDRWRCPTQFKQWTVRDVIGHLHLWNIAAYMSLTDEPALVAFLDDITPHIAVAGGMRRYTDRWLGTRSGAPLAGEWIDFCRILAERFAEADAKRRLKWVGPTMSARSAITARLMETWAHGQAIYDLAGIERTDADRIRNIAFLGVGTFAWSFTNRGLAVPGPAPHVRLTAPSGALWLWNDDQPDNRVEGAAGEFCQVVTQVRNVADTSLVVVGPAAERWMAIAQCFAGPPEDPPAPGTRYRRGARQ